MQTYKVDVKHETAREAVHVSATTREHAVYQAFNNMSDRGYTVVSMGDVSMFDEATDTWHVIPDHRAVSKLVA